MNIGISTGALFKSDFRLAIEFARAAGLHAIELSALRHYELEPVVNSLRDLDLSGFEHVSLHVPSSFAPSDEGEVLRLLNLAQGFCHALVVHPNVLYTPIEWSALGNRLLIENMDKRKPIGRTAEELAGYFQDLPEALFCFDIAHARQVDSTMNVGYTLLRQFGDKLAEIHISHVNTESKHDPLTFEAISAFRELAHLIPHNIPIVIESAVTPDSLTREVEKVEEVFALEAAS